MTKSTFEETVALSVSDLTVSYGRHVALHDVSFNIASGKLVGFIGPNGAGKSTLMKAILGGIPKDNGVVRLFGNTIQKMRKEVAYVQQRNNIDWDFPIDVFDTVLLGTYPRLGLFRRPQKVQRQKALECLEKVEMVEFKHRQIGELSGGQQQRIFLARALAQAPKLFFLDEPFVGIDIKSEEKIIAVLKELRDQGKTVIVVHHDLSKAKKYFNELLLINVEVVDSGETEAVLHPDTISKAYKGFLPVLQAQEELA